MRRTLIVLAVVVAGSVVAASSAQAATRWPAKCKNMKCVNAHLNNLHAQSVKLKNRVANDETTLIDSAVCEGDALVNETLNEADNETLITGEVGPIASKVGIDCSTDWWPLFDPSLFPRPALPSALNLNGVEAFRLSFVAHLTHP